MSKSFLTLQPSEGIVVQAAAQIYAAYIQSGQVGSGQEAEWMKKSIKEAMQLAKAIDELVVSDDDESDAEEQVPEPPSRGDIEQFAQEYANTKPKGF